ncbi:MAG TPA: hypothetical protein PLS49_06960 [Candidatus Woesebacteria bacterium]|nr:hypothetical protein [Candidatus Woesebacteria bacterium]
MKEHIRFKEQAVRLATLGLLSVGLIGCAPDMNVGTRTDLPIPRSEFTDPVGEPINRFPGAVDGILNPPGKTNVVVSGQEAWVDADEDGYPKPGYSPFK